MMNDPARPQARYEDLLNLPEQLVGEILNGQLYTSPRPAPRHALAYSSLGYDTVQLPPFDAISFPLDGLWS